MFYRAFVQAKIVLLVLVFTSCNKELPEKKPQIINAPVNYSFVVASIQSNDAESAVQLMETMSGLITPRHWKTFGLSQLQSPVIDESLMNPIKSGQYYMAQGDLFIEVITDEGMFTRQHLSMIRKAIDVHSNAVNIFVLMDQVPWYNQHSIFKRIKFSKLSGVNYIDLNFWNEVEPMFKGLPQQVYFVGGAMGRSSDDEGYMYFHYANLHILATGAGKSPESNVLCFKVHDAKEVSIELHPTANDTVFDLTTYSLPYSQAEKKPLKPVSGHTAPASLN